MLDWTPHHINEGGGWVGVGGGLSRVSCLLVQKQKLPLLLVLLCPAASCFSELRAASFHSVSATVNSNISTQIDFPHQLYLVFKTGKQDGFSALLLFLMDLLQFSALLSVTFSQM